MTNSQWARLQPLLPQGIEPGRPQVWTRRQLVDGIRWRTRTGAPWRHVPERYGPWDRVYDLFRRRRRDGTWAQILTRLQAAPDASAERPSPNCGPWRTAQPPKKPRRCTSSLL
ncbi:transposase [Streptomyces virginiae]|uniref:transposase n=1 Tax=Streptomyces virginiae TaxID=1961 RepID=UPI00366285AB